MKRRIISLLTAFSLLCATFSFSVSAFAKDALPGSKTVVVEAEAYTGGEGSFWGKHTDSEISNSASGGACIRFEGGAATVNYTVDLPVSGKYEIAFASYSVQDAKGWNKVLLDKVAGEYFVLTPAQTGGWQECELSTAAWDQGVGDFVFTPVGGVELPKGSLSFSLKAEGSGPWLYYDRIVFTLVEQSPLESGGGYQYEAEAYTGSSGTFWENINYGETGLNPPSGNAGIRLGDGAASIRYDIEVPEAGDYLISVLSGSIEGNSGRNKVTVNGKDYSVDTPECTKPDWVECPLETNTEPGVYTDAGPISLTQGKNTIELSYAGGGWLYYDAILLKPYVEGEAAEAVNLLIESLPGEVSLSDETQIKEAYSAYRALSAAEKLYVTNIGRLILANARLDALLAGSSPEETAFRYELEDAGLSGGAVAVIDGSGSAGYSGTGFVSREGGKITAEIYLPGTAQYIIDVISSTAGNDTRCDNVTINGVGSINGNPLLLVTPPGSANQWVTTQPGASQKWSEGVLVGVSAPKEGFTLNEKKNVITIEANWSGDCCYDALVITPLPPEEPPLSVGEINELITSLPETVTLADREAVQKAYADYRSLTDEERDMVTGAEALVMANARVNALARDPSAPKETLRYEFEDGGLSGNTVVSEETTIFPSFGGSGYIFLFDASSSLEFYVPENGYYKIYVVSGTTEAGDKCDYVSVDGGNRLLVATMNNEPGNWKISEPGKENYSNGVLAPAPEKERFVLRKGYHTLNLSANWGYCAYDSIIVEPYDYTPPAVVPRNVTVFAPEELTERIDALPDVITLKDENNVRASYHAYRELLEEDRALVENADQLIRANARISALRRDAAYPQGVYAYDLEYADLFGNTMFVASTSAFKDFGYNGYAYLYDQKIIVDVYAPQEGQYRIFVVSGSTEDGAKCDYLRVNGSEKFLISTPAGKKGEWQISEPGWENWSNGILRPTPPAEGFHLKEGKNEIVISANWGYCAYDELIVVSISEYAAALDKQIEDLPEILDAQSEEAFQAAYRNYQMLPEADRRAVSKGYLLDILYAQRAAKENSSGLEGEGILRYELEDASLNGNTAAVADTSVFSESGGGSYVFLFDNSLSMSVSVPKSGYYRMYVLSGTTEDGEKCDFLTVNNGTQLLVYTPGGSVGRWQLSRPGTENYKDGKLSPLAPANGIWLEKGRNTVELKANWGYCAYDSILLVPAW